MRRDGRSRELLAVAGVGRGVPGPYPSSLISASAFSRQYVMPISQYIVTAGLRCGSSLQRRRRRLSTRRHRRDSGREPRFPSLQPAGEHQSLSGVVGRLVDPPGREVGCPRAQKNERRSDVILGTAELLEGARDQRERLVSTAARA
jgi:hypothetical protein